MPEYLARHGAEVERDATGHPLTRPQMIATDLDGTIIPYSQTHTGYVSPRTLNAFNAALDAGIEVAFVTGRPMRWMTTLAPLLGPMGPAIVSNGAIIYDMNTDTIVEAHPMDMRLVTDVTNQLRTLFQGAIFGAETLTGLIVEPEFITARSQQQNRTLAAAATAEPKRNLAVHSAQWVEADRITDRLAEHPDVVKLMVKILGQDPDELLYTVRTHFGQLVQVTHSVPGVALLEISRGDIHKASTLADYAASRGIHANDVVAFGDQRNDEQMLRWAGTGYALSSGNTGLFAEADVIAPACDDDGVAEMIEHLLTLPE